MPPFCADLFLQTGKQDCPVEHFIILLILTFLNFIKLAARRILRPYNCEMFGQKVNVQFMAFFSKNKIEVSENRNYKFRIPNMPSGNLPKKNAAPLLSVFPRTAIKCILFNFFAACNGHLIIMSARCHTALPYWTFHFLFALESVELHTIRRSTYFEAPKQRNARSGHLVVYLLVAAAASGKAPTDIDVILRRAQARPRAKSVGWFLL